MTYAYNKKWRLANPETRHAGKKHYYQKTQDATNGRKSWTTKDIEVITAENRLVDSVLAAQLGRSVQAIQQKRHREAEPIAQAYDGPDDTSIPAAWSAAIS